MAVSRYRCVAEQVTELRDAGVRHVLCQISYGYLPHRTIVDSMRTPLQNPDFSPFLQRIKDARPEAAFIFVPSGQGAAIMKQFDKNGNHQIDGPEIADLKTAFAASAPGTALKKLDRNGNGVLDEDEITALNARAGSGDGAKAKKKK